MRDEGETHVQGEGPCNPGTAGTAVLGVAQPPTGYKHKEMCHCTPEEKGFFKKCWQCQPNSKLRIQIFNMHWPPHP